jgi:hypothetical protein
MALLQRCLSIWLYLHTQQTTKTLKEDDRIFFKIKKEKQLKTETSKNN